MSTLRVDNIKGRTGTTVNIPDSNNLSVSGSLSVSGVTTFTSSGELNLQGVNINSGTRGDVLAYDSNGKISKLTLGAAGQILKSDGTDLVFGDLAGATNVYYVTKNGVDASGRGGSIDSAWASIKYACSNLPTTPTKTSPAVIFVKSGTYLEAQLPIIVPEYCTIVGDNLRATTVKPAPGLDSGGSIVNQRSTLFRCSNGVIIQDIICEGMDGYQVGSPASDPTAGTLGGVYFALNAQSPITDKSPYIYNVTTFGNGATGAVVDGSLHSSGNRSMLFHTVTHIHSDGLGIWAKDNANAEIISGFTYYCQIGYTATGGSIRMLINQPLVASDRKEQLDITCSVTGGGLSGQAGAVRHGISKALVLFEPELKKTLKSGGFLTRDSRVVERKKYGRRKARRSFQFSKR